MEQKLYDAAARLPETSLDFQSIQPTAKSIPMRRTRKAISSLAACLVLLVSIGFVAAEAREYSNAIQFFNKYDLSTDGLSRGEIKAVYRDITTKSFTYSKTAEVITNSLSADQVGGYEIPQDNPTPEDIENLWNYKNYQGEFLTPERHGFYYKLRTEYWQDPPGRFHDKQFLEKYDGDNLLWSIPFSDMYIDGYFSVSDGVIVQGFERTSTVDLPNFSDNWMVKIDSAGNILWKHKLTNGSKIETISEIFENSDGSFAVIGRVDYKYLYLSHYTADGEQTYFKKTEIGYDYGIGNIARFKDGYIVEFYSDRVDAYTKIVKVDCEGNITDSFSYGSEDTDYFIADMIEYNGHIYLSGYSVPKVQGWTASNKYELASVLVYLQDNKIREISSEELTPMIRDNYTAMLLVCDPTAGTIQEFYSVKGSLGADLSISDSGMLLWDVESITTTFYSPTTSSFTFGGTSYVFEYTYDCTGRLVSQEKTGEVVKFRR